MKVLLIYIMVSLIIRFMMYNLRSSEYVDGYIPSKTDKTDNKDTEISDWILSLILGAIATAIILASVW